MTGRRWERGDQIVRRELCDGGVYSGLPICVIDDAPSLPTGWDRR